MHKDVDAVWNPIQSQFIDEVAEMDKKALELYNKDPEQAIQLLNDYSNRQGKMVMDRCIELGDFLWTKYDEKF